MYVFITRLHYTLNDVFPGETAIKSYIAGKTFGVDFVDYPEWEILLRYETQGFIFPWRQQMKIFSA